MSKTFTPFLAALTLAFTLPFLPLVSLAADVATTATPAARESNAFFYGKVTANSQTVKGAMVSFFHGKPVHSLTVFTDDQGRFLTPALPWGDGYTARIRRAGWKDTLIGESDPHGLSPRQNGTWLDVGMERITDSQEMIQQLPGNYWMNLVLEEMKGHPDHLLEFKTQCTGCHQQGSPLTSRRQFTRKQWVAIIHDMGTRSAILTDSLRNALPDYLLKAYDEKNVLAKLPKYDGENGSLPLPDANARKAVIEEWVLGGPTSSQHDMMVYHPDGSIWAVDGPLDVLHKISFINNPDGNRTDYAIPRGDHKPGGIYYKMSDKKDDYLGAHSLQTAPNGDIWLTLASGNQLAGFNPSTEKWEMVDLKEGINPHTLRFDKKGRIWFTMSATNHVGMFDPATKEQKFVSLPAPDLKTKLILWVTPFLISHADWFNLKENSAKSNGVSMPVPYGIDINPIDGSVWYSQLYMRHIGRIDPETLEVTSIATPFDSPRRLRFDSKGGLWIPSYSEGSIHLFDTKTMQWIKSWTIPVEPIGSEVPYAVFVDKQTDEVWITGTQSDSIIRFNPATEQWTRYPLPMRVTYTREMDMDDQHRIWTSHSSFPTWHIEGGLPKVVRVDPNGAPDINASGVFKTTEIAPVTAKTVSLKAQPLKK